MHSLVESIPTGFITTVHIFVCFLLIFFVLIQDSKGGGVFGSSSQSILGPTGAPTLFAKLTRYSAILFAITSLVLTIQTTPSNRSAVDSYVPPAPQNSSPQDTGSQTTPKKDPVPEPKKEK